MSKIGLFYGTTLGGTESIAGEIQKHFGDVEIHNISNGIEKISEYDKLIFGTNTWGYGELQDDWNSIETELDKIDFTNKKVAIYGTGDQEGYPDTFVDAIGLLYEKVKNNGGEVVGFTLTEGYEFSDSKALLEDKFVGLAIDDNNQGGMTQKRIENWVEQLKNEL